MVLGGRFGLRACIVNYATTADDVAALVDIVHRVGAHCIDVEDGQ